MSQVKALILHSKEMKREIVVKETTVTANVAFPSPFRGSIRKNTHRFKVRMRMDTFPINISNARTVHKLQGKSLDAILVSAWDCTDNWTCVVLSRVKTRAGLFIRKPLEHKKCNHSAKNSKFSLAPNTSLLLLRCTKCQTTNA